MLNLPPEFKNLVSADARIKYYSNNYFKQLFLQRFFEKAFYLVETSSPGSIIEVGCGDGLAGYLLKQKFKGISYLGADIRKAELLAAAKVLGPDLLMLNAADLPFEDNSFDLALFLEVFEHAGDWERLVQEGIRVSARALIFSVPAFPWYQVSNLVFGKNLSRLGEHPDHINQFTFKGLQGKIEQAIKKSDKIANKAKAIEIDCSFPWAIGKIVVQDREQSGGQKLS